MTLPSENWKNKGGTCDRDCVCGTWKQHWINFSGEQWPSYCSVLGCSNPATLGAHIFNKNNVGEWIIPGCDECNKFSEAFNLKNGIRLVSADKSQTCEKSK